MIISIFKVKVGFRLNPFGGWKRGIGLKLLSLIHHGVATARSGGVSIMFFSGRILRCMSLVKQCNSNSVLTNIESSDY